MDYLKKISEYVRNNRLAQHLVFWMVIVVTYIPAGLLDENNDPLWVILLFNFCVHIPQMLASYFLAYYLLPKFILKKRYFLSLILFFLTCYIFSALARILTIHVGEELVRTPPFEQESVYEILTDLHSLVVKYFPSVYTVSFQFLFVKYFFNNEQKKSEATQLEQKKVESELKMLKAQLNPHFLFNTLNNIYSLSLDNSPKTASAIGKLSDILDHVLYKCNNQFVSLSSEIELMKNYIELEKLRYDNRLEITFDTDLENDMQIPPLLLLSLVENAFKHGAGEDSGSPKIWISIIQTKEVFTFKISNTVSSDYVSKDEHRIGLTNIKKQLDLIYSDNYSLDIKQAVNSFSVVLQINQNDSL
ncbi:sensor histidine kinase [Flavobacterium sp. WW92]|uniref:sensor histidine kinase n=1 Tax=unclassified Flavobacterium TaxID=196869 RepID=UPI00222513E3|nr:MULTISPECIES: sensor histidine kinase [unclassified Flavobacterium]WDO14628.1 sensor histidine kinase [Flavobacterium sp. WW92]